MSASVAAANLPVAVVGAGPVGLAAAAHLLEQGEEPVVFEAGGAVGTGVLAWGHVRLFSPWRYVVDAAAERLLTASGWTAPDADGYPTGREVVERYLAPLARGDVPLKLAMELARHSDARLTMKVYSHVGLHDLAGALDKLPE